MCEVIDIMINKGREEGLAEGRQEGLAEGLATGRQEGLAEGRQEGLVAGRQKGLAEGRQEGFAEGLAEGAELEKKNIAQGMKKKGFDISLIMELTGLSKEMILSL